MAVNTRNSIVTNGLVIYVDAANRKSYTSGSSIYSTLVPGYTGSISVETVTSQSFNGYSLTANSGSNIAQIFFPSNDPFFNRQEATIELWINPPAADQNVNAQTIYFGGGSTNNLIQLYRNSNTPTNQYAWVMYCNTSAGSTFFLGFHTYTPYQWCQTVLTYNSTGTATVYVNGIQRATQTFSNFLQWNLTSANNVGVSACMTGKQNGSFSTMKYYNRSLSAAEVLQNYNATKTRFGLS